jgi:hypothetical protein
MPNHCLNTLITSSTTLPVILARYIHKDETGKTIFDFESIVPVGDVPDWHKQRLEKWGTKWVGYDLQIGESTIDFFTAWTAPIPIIVKLAELHHELILRLEYSEPGTGFRGVAVAKWQGNQVVLENNCRNMTAADLEELGLT